MKKLLGVLFVFVFALPAIGQGEQGARQIEIFFDHNSCAIDREFSSNGESLDELSGLILSLQCDSLVTITRVEVDSYASPEGDLIYNNKLSVRRSDTLHSYLTEALHLPDSIIQSKSSGIDWEGLARLVEESDMRYKGEVLHIIENQPEETWRRVNPGDRWQTLVDSRNKHLMDLRYGEPYRDMYSNIYPLLRRGSILTIYFKATLAPMVEESVEIAEATQQAEVEEEIIEEAEPEIAEPQETDEKELKFALKTNLLYDLALAPNIELEIPIKERFSVAGEWIFPWWTTKDNGNAMQILSGQVEGRYWFGERESRPQLTGWFAGLYAGGGLYDLQWQNNGYQGEFYIAAGLSGGYAHTINKRENLRLEYSLGIGYLKTDYRYYEGKEDNEFLVWQYDGTYTWVGPTRAKVSLVWLIDWKRGGVR